MHGVVVVSRSVVTHHRDTTIYPGGGVRGGVMYNSPDSMQGKFRTSSWVGGLGVANIQSEIIQNM